MRSIRTLIGVCVMGLAMMLFVGGCKNEVNRPFPPALTDREWVEAPFEKVTVVRNADRRAVAIVLARQLTPEETRICNILDDLVRVLGEGGDAKKGRDLPMFVHQPKTGEAYPIEVYHLVDSTGKVINTLELD